MHNYPATRAESQCAWRDDCFEAVDVWKGLCVSELRAGDFNMKHSSH